MKNRHRDRNRGAPSFSPSQLFSGLAFSDEPDVLLLTDDTEVMTIALGAGLLDQILEASRKATGPNRFIVSPPLIVDGFFTAIIYFYGYADAKDNGWLAIQTRDAATLFQVASNLPVKRISGRTPVKGAQPWN